MSGTWIARGRLLAMGMPWRGELEALADDGVAAVISLTERLPEGLPSPRLRHLHLPVEDFHPPTLAQLERAVEFIDATVAAGDAVAVHCGAGLGRTGTVCAAWLVRHGHAARAAIAEVRRRRPGSVEPPEQEAVIEAFERECAARRSAGPGGGS